MQNLISDIKANAMEYGSIPFWSWNDKLEEGELRRQINIMHDLGMKGFFMHARGGLETEYLSEEWYDCIRACVDEAQKLGMEAWSYDENGWPSGFAGGKLLEDPANWATYVTCQTRTSYPSDEHLLAVYVIADGKCRRVTEPEEGIDTYTAIIQGWDSAYVDTMDARITTKFVETIHAEYEEKVGFSRYMPGFFTDEPQYYRWATPWSETLPAAFSERYGYDIYDGLAALFADFDGAKEFRWDYYRLCHELFINGFIKVVYDWCEEHGCKLTGHGFEEFNIAGQMCGCAGMMPFYEYQHIPGIDYLGRGILSDVGPRQLGSACAQLGKKQAISEMFGACGWDVTPRELKRIAGMQYAGGVNMMCQHLYSYSMRGQRKRDWPCHYSEHLPWQNAMSEFNNYFNNLGYLLSRGEEMARILVIHPIHSAYLTYKREEIDASVEHLHNHLEALNAQLCDNQIAYHFGDECMMAKMATVEGNKLRVGLCTYDYVVVPGMESLDSSTAALLRQYLENGGKVWLAGETPSRIDGRLRNLDWLQSNCTFADLQAASSAVLCADGKNVPALRMMARQTQYGKLFFITNVTPDQLESVEFTARGCRGLYELDLNTLTYAPLPVTVHADGSCTTVLDFEDSGSHVLVEAPENECAQLSDRDTSNTAAIPLDGGFTLTGPVTNMMTLDYAQISYDGVTFEHPRSIIQIKDMLLRARYEGDVWLKYTFDTSFIPQSLRMAAEPLEYKSITVNGNPVSLDGDWWFDRSFRTAQLAPYTKAGCNEIVMQVRHYQQEYVYHVLYDGVTESLRNCLNFDTEIESIYLIGDFCVRTDNALMTPAVNNAYCYTGTFCLVPQKAEIDLSNIVTDGYPFFAGQIEAQTVYNYRSGSPTLLCVTGRYAVCEVTVNGTYAGRLMLTNRMDLAGLLHEGDNTIALRLINSDRNLLGPHHHVNPEPLCTPPSIFSMESMWDGETCPDFTDRYSFVRFGIDC